MASGFLNSKSPFRHILLFKLSFFSLLMWWYPCSLLLACNPLFSWCIFFCWAKMLHWKKRLLRSCGAKPADLESCKPCSPWRWTKHKHTLIKMYCCDGCCTQCLYSVLSNRLDSFFAETMFTDRSDFDYGKICTIYYFQKSKTPCYTYQMLHYSMFQVHHKPIIFFG